MSHSALTTTCLLPSLGCERQNGGYMAGNYDMPMQPKKLARQDPLDRTSNSSHFPPMGSHKPQARSTRLPCRAMPPSDKKKKKIITLAPPPPKKKSSPHSHTRQSGRPFHSPKKPLLHFFVCLFFFKFFLSCFVFVWI